MFEHKGYTGAITRTDADSGIFHGRVVGIQDVVTFEGKTASELARAFRDSVDDYLAFCDERRESPEKPFSGKFVVRMTPELHRLASEAASQERVSMNAWIVAAVEQHLNAANGNHSTISFDEIENLAECVAAILAERQRHPGQRPSLAPKARRATKQKAT